MLTAGKLESDVLLITLTLSALTALSNPPDPLLAASTVISLTALLLLRLYRHRRP